MKLKVKHPFTDKFDHTTRYEAGDILTLDADTSDNVGRINDLLARGLCEVALDAPEKESETPTRNDETSATAAPAVSFREKEYPLAAIRVALESIGVPMPKNGGVPSATKTIEELNDEQTAALEAALANIE